LNLFRVYRTVIFQVYKYFSLQLAQSLASLALVSLIIFIRTIRFFIYLDSHHVFFRKIFGDFNTFTMTFYLCFCCDWREYLNGDELGCFELESFDFRL